MSETSELTFEAGYGRLQTIAGRLNEDEVPVSEMCDLYAEGKGLEQALTTFLDEQSSRVEAIERGEGIHAFRITKTSETPPAADGAEGFVVERDDFAPIAAPTPVSADDDIPF